jgi:hypothetical protein
MFFAQVNAEINVVVQLVVTHIVEAQIGWILVAS